MIFVDLEKANRILPRLIQDILMNCEETIIITDAGVVVMVDQAEWENIRETLRLLCDKRSLKALLNGHQTRDRGGRPDSVGVEEAFNEKF